MSSLRKPMLAAIAVGVSLAACAPGGGSKGGGDGSSTVNIGVSSLLSLTWSSHHAAEGQGFLKDELRKVGADYKVTEFSGGGPLFAAMSAGDVDLAFVPTTTVTSLNQKSRGLECVMTLSTGGSSIIVGADKYKTARGTDLAKYDGATWGYSSEGSSARQIDEIVAEAVGLKWPDQKGLALGSTTAAGPALATGRVDLVTFDSASAQQTLDKGTGYVVLNTNNPHDSRYPYPKTGNCIAASTDFIEQHRDEAQAVVTAELKALLLIQDHLDDGKAVVGLFPGRKDGSAWNAEEWSLVAPSFATVNGVPDEQTIKDTKAMTERQYDLKLDDAVLKSSFTSELIDAAYKSLGRTAR
jgi:NitT/TauT family transport system substrate-binding protein